MKSESKKASYDKEFKIMLCELIKSGQSVTSVSKEYGVHVSSLHKWKHLYNGPKEAFTGSGKPSLTAEEKEIRRLKKVVKEISLERDILKKAVSIFSASDKKNMNL